MARLLRLTKTLRLNQADFRFAKFNLLRLRLAKDLFEPGPGHDAQSGLLQVPNTSRSMLSA